MKKLKKMVLSTTAEVLSSNQMRQMLGGGSTGYGSTYLYYLSCNGYHGPFKTVNDCKQTTMDSCGYMGDPLCVTMQLA